MKKVITMLLLIFTLTACLSEELAYEYEDQQLSNGDINELYEGAVYDEIIKHEDIEYGENISQGGEKVKLLMDIYEPKESIEEKRPLVIFAYGGGFITGEKEYMADECRFFAEAGYVAASINYRLVDSHIERENDIAKRAMIDAVHDMKAAIRYFNKDVAEENLYRIDSKNIFASGHSAGAFTSLHAAYLDQEDLINWDEKELVEYIENMGGLEGTSGNAGYASDIRGVLNMSGGLLDLNLIQEGEAVLFSVHGTDDDVVPYKKGESDGSGVEIYGSYLIHQVAEGKVNNLLWTIEGGGHDPYEITEEWMYSMRSFVKSNLIQ